MGTPRGELVFQRNFAFSDVVLRICHRAHQVNSYCLRGFVLDTYLSFVNAKPKDGKPSACGDWNCSQADNGFGAK